MGKSTDIIPWQYIYTLFNKHSPINRINLVDFFYLEGVMDINWEC